MDKFIILYKNMSKPAKASIWFVFCSVIQKGIAMLTTPIFTRILSQKEYGTVSIYNSWLSILTVFATMELATGVFNKAMVKYEDDRDGYTSSTLILSSCLTMGLFIIYLIGRKWWNSLLELNTAMMVMMFIEIFFTEAMSFWTIRQRFDYHYRSVIAFTLVANIAGTLLSMFLVMNSEENRAEYRVLGTVLVHVILYGVVFYLILKRGKRSYVREYWRYALWYNAPLIPHYLSQMLLNQSDKIMIGRFCGNEYSAIYTVAYQVAVVMNIITVAINASYSPWAYQRIKTQDVKPIGKTTLVIIAAFSGACFLFSLLAPEMILILGGKQYYSAIWIVPPVAMSIVFNVMYSLISNIAFYYEKRQFVMIGTIISAVSNIILNAVFIPIYGFVAAGYTTLVCYIIYAIAHYAFMIRVCDEKKMEMPYNTVAIWAVAMVSVALSIVSGLLYNYSILRYCLIISGLFVGAMAGLIIYKKRIRK